MKKFLALMFVCAGLSAMAITPVHVNNANLAQKAQKGEMLMKSNTLANEMCALANGQVKQSKSFNMQTMPKLERRSIADNKAMSKKAPRRLSNADLITLADSYLDFKYVSSINEAGDDLEWSYYHFRGAEGVKMQEDEDGTLTVAGFFWDDDEDSPAFGSTWYLDMNVDYDNGTVTVPMGYSLLNDTTTGTYSSTTGYRVDVIVYRMLVDANYYYYGADDVTDITGTLYSDGSIELESDNGYVYAGWDIKNYYTRSGRPGNYTYALHHSDTTYIDEAYFGTQFLVPNATQTYEISSNSYDQDVYMFQYDDTTVLIYGISGGGMPYSEVNIYEDGTAVYSLNWPLNEHGNYYRWYNNDYYSSTGYDFSNIHYTWPYGIDEAGELYTDSVIVGTVTPTQISWTQMAEYAYPLVYNNTNYSWGYRAANYVFKFKDGTQFLVGVTATPVITSEETDDAVIVTATCADEGAVVALYQIDENGNIIARVDNPYTIERTDEDQVLYFAAVAQADGKNVSDPAIVTVEVPALASQWKLGDVNHDDKVDVSDVTALIAYILGNQPDVFYIEQANVNQDAEGKIDVSDVTALIAMILGN